MKKKKIVIRNSILIALVLTLVIGGSFLVSLLVPDNYTASTVGVVDEEIAEEEQKDFTLIGIDEYLSLKKGSDKAVIYIARPTCTYCKTETPRLKHIAYLYDLTIYYLNTDELSKEDKKALVESDAYFADGYGTPLILIVQNDTLLETARGLRSITEIVELFDDTGIIGTKDEQ